MLSRHAEMVRGSVVRRAHVNETETLEDGSEATISASGIGLIMRVQPDSRSRREFKRAAERFGVILTDVESVASGDGTYNRRTGQLVSGREVTVDTFQCVGEYSALAALKAHPAVIHTEVITSVRTPHGGMGTGPEKVRTGPNKPKPAPVYFNEGERPSVDRAWERFRDHRAGCTHTDIS